MDERELPPPPTAPEGELVWIAGGEVDRVEVSLRFFGDDLDPDTVSELLGCQPTKAHRKGDVLPSTRYRRIAKTGSWRLHGPKDEEGDLEEKISRLLGSVSADPAAWSALAPYHKDVFCGLFLNRWNRGCSLSPELMGRLAERGLTVDLDIYCGEEEDE